MKIAVVSPQVPRNIKKLINVSDYKIYACDSAVEALVEQNISIDLAIGDFDSLKNLSLLEGIKTIKLPTHKDCSDTSYAINHAYNHSDNVILIGGIKGSRTDHLFANLLLINKFNDLIIMDETNKIFRLNVGVHEITKDNYEYLSVFPLEVSKITISGTEYVLNNKQLSMNNPLGLSNIITDSEAIIEVHSGALLVFQSK